MFPYSIGPVSFIFNFTAKDHLAFLLGEPKGLPNNPDEICLVLKEKTLFLELLSVYSDYCTLLGITGSVTIACGYHRLEVAGECGF